VQVVLSRLAKRYGVETVTEPVKVAYRETLAGPAEAEGKHKKQTGGRGQFGVAFVRFEPLDRGAGFDFVDQVTGGAVPKGLIPAVGKGINESMVRGGPNGFPLVDLRATLFDGKYHSVDSDEMSFKMAGAMALRAAIEKVGTVVLEPVSRIQITAPTDLQGDVMADLSGRRGQIENTDQHGNGHVTVTAIVPTSEILDYAVALRSMTHGRGHYRCHFDHYQVLSGPLPAAAQVAARK
jgi:elongation factor G